MQCKCHINNCYTVLFREQWQEKCLYIYRCNFFPGVSDAWLDESVVVELMNTEGWLYSVQFFFFLVRLEFEFRASCSQSWHSTSCATSPVHFTLVILEMRCRKLFVLASNCNSPDLSLPSSWDYKGEPLMPSCVQLFISHDWQIFPPNLGLSFILLTIFGRRLNVLLDQLTNLVFNREM
jgi:hypothetical protein